MIKDSSFETELNRIISYINSSQPSFLTEKSEIWETLITQRKKEYNIESMNNFLSGNSNEASGTGSIGKRYSGYDTEVLEYIESLLSKDYINRITPSWIGNPPKVKIFGCDSNLAFLWNMLRFQHYHQILEEAGTLNAPLHIIEIGPGYGAAAYNFVQSSSVASYTLVDLPENLINSFYFLRKNFRDWNYILVDEHNPASNKPNTFNFVSADRFDCLKGTFFFDLALNTDSFGEMPAEVAKGYIDQLPDLLKSEGIFVSMNGHRRGQYELTGFQKVSDYGYSNFTLLDFSYKPYFSSAYDDFGHCAILSNKPSPINIAKTLDVFGDLFSMGINKDLDTILSCFNRSQMTDAQSKQIAVWNDILEEKSEKSDDIIAEYIIFLRKALCENTYADSKADYLFKSLKSPQARYYIKLVKYLNNKLTQTDIDELRANPDLRFLASDLLKYDNTNYFIKIIYKMIRKAHLSKKAFPRRKFKLPPVLKAKQIYQTLKTKMH